MDLKSSWWMLLLMAVVLVIFIVSSVGSKKRKRQEKQKRQKEVKEVLKNYMRDELNLRHKTVEFDQVIARSSKDYRYRDVFDVVVKLYDSKKNDLYATKAFEVEGFAKQISKKEFETIWKVNSELDLDETLKRITLEKRKSKKIKKKTADDKKLIADEKAALKASIQEEKQLAKDRKNKAKSLEKPKIPVSEKFTGIRD